MASRWKSRDRYESMWPAYVPVAERARRAEKEVLALRKKGRTISPVVIAGREIATTFWGKAWCANLESYSDYANRLPRGRSYVRNGSVVHLGIAAGKVDALVSGTSMYTVKLAVGSLAKPRWTAVVDECSGQVSSLVELLQGKLSRGVMEIVTSKDRGLFPSPEEIDLSCSCPDWATMCKHVAAVMYGVGARLDAEPALLFRLRGVDPAELLSRVAVGRAKATPRVRGRTLAEGTLGSVFGIDIDEGETKKAPAAKVSRARESAPKGDRAEPARSKSRKASRAT